MQGYAGTGVHYCVMQAMSVLASTTLRDSILRVSNPSIPQAHGDNVQDSTDVTAIVIWAKATPDLTYETGKLYLNGLQRNTTTLEQVSKIKPPR